MNPIFKFNTYPFCNLTEGATWDRLSNWAKSDLRPAVVRAKEALGKQDYCWVGEFRYYIWERPFDFKGQTLRWRLFASKRGLDFEVEGSPVDEGHALAIAATDAFLKAWGYKETHHHGR